MMQEVSRV